MDENVKVFGDATSLASDRGSGIGTGVRDGSQSGLG